jgi:tripartite-type tricarboxylate transporter receptor subunit TctC
MSKRYDLWWEQSLRASAIDAGRAINDMVAGQIDFACNDLSAAVSQIEAGTIKAMAISTPERSNVAKDVPTTKEAGLPEFQVSAWNAIFAPKSLPQNIQARLNDALVKALDDEATGKRPLQIGSVIPDDKDRTPEALRQFSESEIVR